MELQKLLLRNFKGIRDFTFNPNGQSVSVFGENEVGKSTLEDAQRWLLTDTDRFGNSTGYFSLKPIINGQIMHAADYSVEGTYTHEGETIVLKKVYQEIWSRNKRSAEEVLDRHTTNHYINGDKVKKREYEDFIDELMSQEMFLMLSNPKYLAKEMHKDDRRKLLTQMSDDYTIDDIITGHPKLERYPKILNGSTHERVEDRLDTRRKDLNKQLDDIPGRIDENQNKIEKVDGLEEAREIVESLKTKKEKIVAKKNELKSGGTIADLKVQQQELEADKQKAKTEHQKQVNESLATQREKVSNLQDKIDEAESDWRVAKREYETLEDRLNNKQDDITTIKSELAEIKDKEPEPANAFEPEKCPVCEQTMPDAEEHDYEAYLEEFNEEKAENIRKTKGELEEAEQECESVGAQLEAAGEKASKAKGLLNQRKQALEKAEAELKDKKQNQPDFTDTDTYTDVQEQINEIGQKIENYRAEKEGQLAQLNNEISKVDDQIEEANDVISKAKNNKIYRDRIAELQENRKEIAGELEEVESDLRVLELYQQAESEYITANVNGMFEVVEWKLFKELMNGGSKPICEAQVDGVPFEDINTAKKIQAGIDIIQTLSEYFEMEAPVFVDNAEGVGDYPENNLQIISLVYSRGDKEIRVEKDLDYHLQTANPANSENKEHVNKSEKELTAV